MIRNRILIHYLLVICIGLMPLVGSGAEAGGHADHVTTGLVDCHSAERLHDPVCDSENCQPAAHACAAYFCAGFIPENTLHAGGRKPGTSGFIPAAVAFNSYPAGSIYRPPIS